MLRSWPICVRAASTGLGERPQPAPDPRPALPRRRRRRARHRRRHRAALDRPRGRDRARAGGADRGAGPPGWTADRARDRFDPRPRPCGRASRASMVVEADARSWPYASLVRPPGGRVLVVGNLPYSVGTVILTALIEARSAIDEMVIMLQREVAERVAATPGSKSYGSLSVLTQLVSEPTVVLNVPPRAFRPPPKVESALLRVTVLPAPAHTCSGRGAGFARSSVRPSRSAERPSPTRSRPRWRSRRSGSATS